MGFLNFLNRRSNHEGGSGRSFRLQNGHPVATSSVHNVGAHSTVRRPSLENIHNSTDHGRSRQQLSGPAKPYFLGIRGDQPSTANSDDRPGPARQRVYRTATVATKSSMPSTSSVTASESCSSTRTTGHIDLLDAQGGIKPCDFRSRIEAAGVRDYGEDVAERNIGENGVDVRSPAAQEFYNGRNRMSTLNVSRLSHILETNESIYSGSGSGSEADDLRNIDGSVHPSTRPWSRLSMEPRHEVSGVVACKPPTRTGSQSNNFTVRGLGQSPKASTSQVRRRHSASNAHGRRLQTSHFWMSTEQPVAGTIKNGRWQSRHRSTDSRSRSISPPCVPRYRPGSSMTTMHEGNGPQSQRDYEQSEWNEQAKPSGQDSAIRRRDPCFVLRRDDFQNDNLDRQHRLGGDESDEDTQSSIHNHYPPASGIVAAAPPQYHPDWQSVVQLAVEKSLAKLPLSADLKTLLELSQSGIPLDDLLQKLPMRHSPIYQGSTISTTPTTELSDYASSNAGRPHSRHTTTTSIDSSAMNDFLYKGGSSPHEDRSSVPDPYQGSPYLSPVGDEDVGTIDAPTVLNARYGTTRPYNASTSAYENLEPEESQCPNPGYYDDPFHQTPRQTLDEDETKLFNGGVFGDMISNLPGIDNRREPRDCTMCNMLVDLVDNPGPIEPCTHNGPMSQKQRLRALGYDYESEESDSEPEVAPIRGRPRTKLTVGSNGGLRRLRLVDERIDEASEEEQDDNQPTKKWSKLGRRA